MVPYVLPQFVVGLVLLFPHAILHEAAITFLGFGLPPEMPAIGIILYLGNSGQRRKVPKEERAAAMFATMGDE